MAVLNPECRFQRWILTEQEELQGSIFSITQKQFIQNAIADKAEERLSLDYDPVNPIKFAQAEAHIKGSIAALQYLLDTSNTSEEFVLRPR